MKRRLTILSLILIVLAGAALYAFKPYVVNGPSMYPTYHDGEEVLVDTLSKTFVGPRRGEAFLFREPHLREEVFIKRVVGLPGETVKVLNDSVTIVRADGSEEVFGPETLIGKGNGQNGNGSPVTMLLGSEDYFVLGDNRSDSTDSRTWGTVQPPDFIGRPISTRGLFGRIAFWLISLGATDGRAEGAYTIDNSLRFNDDDSAYLTRTLSTGDRQKWTYSGWFKRGNVGGFKYLFDGGPWNGGNSEVSVRFDGNASTEDSIAVAEWNGASTNWTIFTTGLHRDPSAWYHVVVAVDTTQATQANRIRVYLNGAEASIDGSSTYPSQNANTGMNVNGIVSAIGRWQGGADRYFDGYMSDVYFVDGQQLTPSSFGETDATTGTWKPKAYSGTYGTNGFYLDFANSTDLGNDVSGNNNDWTANNLQAIDQTIDTPSNNFATGNMLVPGSGSFSNGNLEATGAATSTILMTTGKWYWEVTATTTGVSAGVMSESGASSTSHILIGKTMGFKFDADAGTLSTTTDGTTYSSTVTGLTGGRFAYVAGGGSITNYGQGAIGSNTTTYLTSGTSHTVASDWDSKNNWVEAIGGGGGGANYSSASTGAGGGGAYSRAVGVSLTAGGSVTYAVGSGGGSATAGGDTYFCNSTSNCASIAGSAVKVGAKGGSGASGATGGAGGVTASGVGSTKYAGGTGGTATNWGGAGGGGAAGPYGAGANGGSITSGNQGGGGGGGAGGGTAGGAVSSNDGGAGGTNYAGATGGTAGTCGAPTGGNGSNGTGGGGGAGNNLGGCTHGAGGAGGAGTEWDSTHGAGGGGGGNGDASTNGALTAGSGGLYGGGGGGVSDDPSSLAGSGAQGIVVLRYLSTSTRPTYYSAAGGYFQYAPPTDHKALSTANMDAPAIEDPGDYFEAKTYAGTGSSQSVTGVGFQPDFVWIKNRTDAATSHALFDAVRGLQRFLSTNSTAAEDTDDTESVSSFDATGFTLGTGGSTANVNTSAKNYASWLWKEGATPGFDIVTYSGNDTSNRTISHTLGNAPEFAIVKRTDSTSNWWAWHSAGLAGATYFLDLNSTDAQTNTNTPWGTGGWTSSTFMVTDDATENANASGYGLDLTSGQTYTASSNEGAGTPPSDAVDGSVAAGDSWRASVPEHGAGANGVSYWRIQFSAAKTIRRLMLYQGDDGSTALRYVTSILFQYSDDGSSWTTAATHNSLTSKTWLTLDNADVGAHVYWRLLANSSVQAADTWIINEVEMMEAASSDNYVAYLWSEVPGFSKFGTYTGNGSTNGPFVWTGFMPRFVLMKVVSTTGDWELYDSARDDTYPGAGSACCEALPANEVVYPNTSGAQATQSSVDWLANGFKLRDSTAVHNAAGSIYVYAAFADYPFQYASYGAPAGVTGGNFLFGMGF